MVFCSIHQILPLNIVNVVRSVHYKIVRVLHLEKHAATKIRSQHLAVN